MSSEDILYSEKYSDNKYEYRHVILPKDIAKTLPGTHLLMESEWRNLGVQQSPGWIHYLLHLPEPHILLFRRRIIPYESDSDNDTDEEDAQKQIQKYKKDIKNVSKFKIPSNIKMTTGLSESMSELTSPQSQ